MLTSNWPMVFWCVCVYIYACVCEYVHVCAHVCCGQRLTLHLLLNHFPCYSLRQGLSWNPEIMDLARRSGPGIPLPLPSAARWSQACVTTPDFSPESWGSDSGPCSRVASTLLSCLASSQLQLLFFSSLGFFGDSLRNFGLLPALVTEVCKSSLLLQRLRQENRMSKSCLNYTVKASLGNSEILHHCYKTK